MNRRDRRIYKRKMRRAGIALAAMLALGATAATAGLAGAYGGGGGSVNSNGNGYYVGGGGGGGTSGDNEGHGTNINPGQEACYFNGSYGLLDDTTPAHDSYSCTQFP